MIGLSMKRQTDKFANNPFLKQTIGWHKTYAKHNNQTQAPHRTHDGLIFVSFIY